MREVREWGEIRDNFVDMGMMVWIEGPKTANVMTSSESSVLYIIIIITCIKPKLELQFFVSMGGWGDGGIPL